ncbi:MAG TPA: hypothetical protein VKT32_09180 [Chthonomonadaceae bacterium]|nr:hypothetical protein [Chthonomonadaceae bacterium]
MDLALKAFQLSTVTSVLLFGYLLYTLLMGKQAAIASMPKADQLNSISYVANAIFYLNISLAVWLLSGLVCFYDSEVIAFVWIGIAVFLAFGFDFCLDYVGRQDVVRGLAPQMTLGEIRTMAVMVGIPGLCVLGYQWIARIRSKARGDDLLHGLTYGGAVGRERRITLPMGMAAFAKCWQLPFCRESIRRQCPIFHAKTKCWKERVGCMCEENIIMLAMAGGEKEQPPVGLNKDTGFVPIGDLIVKSQKETRAQIPTRVGPRGVRIPTNPHLNEEQKRERCRNCVIYNEHQRQKYQLLSVPATLLVPLIVFLDFDNLREIVKNAVFTIDRTFTHVTFEQGSQNTALANQLTGSLPVETIIIICLTLVVMTWVLRLLEYCTFKIKI